MNLNPRPFFEMVDPYLLSLLLITLIDLYLKITLRLPTLLKPPFGMKVTHTQLPAVERPTKLAA